MDISCRSCGNDDCRLFLKSDQSAFVQLYLNVDVFFFLHILLPLKFKLKSIAWCSLLGHASVFTLQFIILLARLSEYSVKSIMDERLSPWVVVSKVGVLPILPIIRSLDIIKFLMSMPRLLHLMDPQEVCQPFRSPQMITWAVACVFKNNSKRLSVLCSSSLGSKYIETKNNLRLLVVSWTMERLGVEKFDIPRVAPILDFIMMHAFVCSLFFGNW